MCRYLTTISVGLGATIFAPGLTLAGEPASDSDLRSRVMELEQQITSLQSQSGANWLNEQRAGEIRALVQDVLADADTRTSLMQGGATAGWDKKFFLASADGNNVLNIAGQVQVRYVFNMQDDEAAEEGDSSRGGFEVRRAKLEFAGHIFNPSWKYKVKGAFDRDGGSFILEDASVNYEYGSGFTVQVGQYKPPFLREETISSSKQLLVDRSLVNEERNQDFAQGVQLSWEGEMFRAAGMIHDGFGSDNTPALAFDTEFAATGRVEAMFAGSWKQFDDFTSWKGEEFGFLLGGALHFQKTEYGTAAPNELEEFMWTLDASAEFGGANLYGAIVGRHLDDEAAIDADRYGAILQGGFFITDDWEVFGRYEWYDFDSTGVEDLNVATVGVNKYWNKHGLKWTTDVGYALDQVNPTFEQHGVGWRGDEADENGQLVIRSQLQLLF